MPPVYAGGIVRSGQPYVASGLHPYTFESEGVERR